MTHRDIGVSDIVYDLAQKGTPKMQVVAKACQTVAGYREVEDFDLATYKSHPHLPVMEGHPVYTCVYLPDDPGAAPSDTYDMPAGRLARSPVELAGTSADEVDRIQHTLRVRTLERLFDTAVEVTDSETVTGISMTAYDAFDEAVVDEARELVEASHFGGEADE